MALKGEKLEVLWNILQMIKEDDPGNVEECMAEALEFLVSAVSASTGAIWLKNEEKNHIYSIVSAGEAGITGFSIELGQGLVGQACESQEPIFIKDSTSDDRFPAGKDEITGLEVKNAYCMPMRLNRKTVGCVELFDVPDEDEFSSEDISLINSFSGLTARYILETGFSYAPDSEKKVIMSLRGIKKDYTSGMDVVRILKGVDLDIYENELLVILGESGCGKSTLLNIIGGMDSQTEGDIEVEGKSFSHPTEKELIDFRRDYIGFIFQAYNLMPNLTAIENVRFIAEICKNPGDPAKAIELVGLTERANNYPSMMSGGQQQRVSIARAIVKNPKMILADEPTAALDFTTGQEVLELIESLISKKLTTVVMVTHNVEIAKMANRVIRVKGGRISSIRINASPMHAADLVW